VKRSGQGRVEAHELPIHDAAAASAEVSVEHRLNLLERAVLRLGQLCLMLAKSGNAMPMAAMPTMAEPPAGIHEVAPVRSLAASLDRSSPHDLIVRVRAAQVARVGLYQAGRLLASAVLVDGAAELHLATSFEPDDAVELRGFDTDGEVAVAHLSL
jgi:hypothetical protein